MDQEDLSTRGSPRSRLVYDAAEIDAYIGTLQSSITELQGQLNEALAAQERAERRLGAIENVELLIGRVLVRAQRAAEETIAAADARAAAVAADARTQAQTILTEAHEQARLANEGVQAILADAHRRAAALVEEAQRAVKAAQDSRRAAVDDRTVGDLLAAAIEPGEAGPPIGFPPDGSVASAALEPDPPASEAAVPKRPTALSQRVARVARATGLVDLEDPFFNPALRWAPAEQDQFYAQLREALQDNEAPAVLHTIEVPSPEDQFSLQPVALPDPCGPVTDVRAPDEPVATASHWPRRRRPGVHALVRPTLTERFAGLLGFE